jgi:hypothetical protein
MKMKDQEGAMKAIAPRLRGFFRVRAGRHSQSPLAAFRDFGAKATPALLAKECEECVVEKRTMVRD